MESLAGKKLLYAITKSNWGGAQVYVHTLARGARDAGAQVAVLAGSADGKRGAPGQLFETLASDEIRTIPLSAITRDIGLLSEWRAFRELLRTLKHERPDVLHLNSSKMGVLGSLAGRLAGIRHIVFTAHGWPHREPRNPFWKMIAWGGSWCTILLCSRIIVVSKLDYVKAPIFFSRRKITVVHNGIEPFELISREQARAALIEIAPHLADKQPWLLMNAELHANKGIDIALQALEHVRTTYRDAALIIQGSGQEEMRLMDLAIRFGVGANAFFTGFAPNARATLAAGDIYLMPSRKEGLPMALLEAGYADLPVVASNVGGIPEIIENHYTGLLVPPENAQDLAFSILSLLDDPDQARILGNNLHRRVLQDFMAERMVRETLALY
jgi:glycosyltransferase involved in cell wall biosynthesis